MPSPNRDPTRITKMAEIRMPIRPSNSFPEEHPFSPSSSDIDSCAEDERERELGYAGGVSGVCSDGYK